ncbi:hsdR [Pantoea dispersa]|uniref:hsdR n=1 Tax=Pantoea dispersa TaxID=59814 RepID=UPI0028DDBFD6|nr:hsdR [Pantoea dispersa]MDT8850249.1 hsdR [Pantoea dispersa]
MREKNDSPLGSDAEALLDNGLSFLNRAREELEAGQVMFSIVSFWTAVEILLKVPLVHEHWTLVCSGKKLERRKYLEGDFQSVTYDDACARLADVLEKPLGKATMAIFDKVRRHRNRVVHFYHNAASDDDLRQIQTEQADAWFALNRLLRDEWAPMFGGWMRFRLAMNETAMLRGNSFYAEARFRHPPVKNELNKLRQTGVTVSQCGTCQQPSLAHNAPVAGMRFVLYDCMVCHAKEPIAEICCPGCGALHQMKAEESDFVCDICNLRRSRYDILSSPPESGTRYPGASGCVSCLSMDSVCEYGDKFLCTYCLELHDGLDTCERCNTISTWVPVNSKEDGCTFCQSWR